MSYSLVWIPLRIMRQLLAQKLHLLACVAQVSTEPGYIYIHALHMPDCAVGGSSGSGWHPPATHPETEELGNFFVIENVFRAYSV